MHNNDWNLRFVAQFGSACCQSFKSYYQRLKESESQETEWNCIKQHFYFWQSIKKIPNCSQIHFSYYFFFPSILDSTKFFPESITLFLWPIDISHCRSLIFCSLKKKKKIRYAFGLEKLWNRMNFFLTRLFFKKIYYLYPGFCIIQT